MKRILTAAIACLLFTGISHAQKAKPVAAKKTTSATKQTSPAKVAGTYSTDLGEDNIVFTTSNDNPTKLTYTISEVEFPMIYDEVLTKKAKGKLVFRHTTMDAYYLLEIAPGVMVHLFSTSGLNFDGTAMLQYVLSKNKADLSKYKSADIRKSLNL
ncbi:MAG TPA: hypothetical protein PK275_09835 [Chitinophagaceae bacterium]|nr:hypothetical protein [Ferruginibacter sp.]HUM98146.1 hypothetical protein [Chitinophagaceae bacterium]